MWHRAVRQHCDLLTIKTRWLNATQHWKLYNHEGFPSDSYVHAFPGTRTRPHSFNPPKTTASKQAILLCSLLWVTRIRDCLFPWREKGKKKSQHQGGKTAKPAPVSQPGPHPALQCLHSHLSLVPSQKAVFKDRGLSSLSLETNKISGERDG